ncbi:neuronal acetylcholine receptor subunit alpha-7-like [Argopecten irradians]|uniref:neuronal acetylcholine receptor subunit alpha-7-like n=1 Tax=Argopecten irradians TaxID=31199 RepID=UPI0037209A5B
MAAAQLGLCVLLLHVMRTPVRGESGSMDDWIRLTNTLLSNYTREIFPLHNFSDTLNIDISMFLMSIIDFDELSGVITLSAGIILTWPDFRLQWTPNDYGGIQKIRINSLKVWVPKVYVINAADDFRQFGADEYDLDITNTGNCEYVPGKLLKATCTVDMSKFPIDTQICSIQIMLWRSPSNVKLSISKSHILMTWYAPNGEWSVDKTDVSFFMGYGTPSTTLDFTVHMSRRYQYFIVSMTIPIMLLCFLNPFVFLLPASSGERISYTITMFLSLTVYMTLINDILPKVSENMAGMTYFLLAVMFYSGIMVLLTIFTLRCDSIEDVREFPMWLRQFAGHFCKVRKNQIFNHARPSEGFVANEQGEPEVDKADVEDPKCLRVQHKDIMRIIDRATIGAYYC